MATSDFMCPINKRLVSFFCGVLEHRSNNQLLSFELNMNSFDFWSGKVCPARQYFAPQSVWSRPKFMGKDDCVDESNYFPAPWYDLVRDLTRLMDVKVHKSRECQGAYNIGSFVWQGSTIIDILVSCFLCSILSCMGLEASFSLLFWCLGQNLLHIDTFFNEKITNFTSNSFFVNVLWWCLTFYSFYFR